MVETTIKPRKHRTKAGRDLVSLGIFAAAILMFVGTGSSVLPEIFKNWFQSGPGPDAMLVNALLLNIALIIFGWRRYSELLIEVDEHRKAEERARILAETDVLTNCLNRRSITPETDALISQAEDEGKLVAFVMFDLDNFKQVNDCHGHQVGDMVLTTTADRIRGILPEGSLLARLGGDEFACVVSFEQHYKSRVDQLVNRLIEAASRPISVQGQEVEVTISAGIAATAGEIGSDDEALDAKSLLHFADIAMYHAKKQGRNRCFWFEDQMEHQLRLRSELEVGIRKGLNNAEFVPYYEQQIDLSTGELMGFEMLARWVSPELGLVKPDVFIPIAEEMGAIAVLSEQLIDQALSDAGKWDPAITLSINISPIQLRDPWFAQKMLKALAKHNFPAQRLEIEITETCLHDNVSLVRSTITSLRNQGIRISLDDFGTGYSSFSQLQSLPFDRLKIDRSFVSNLIRDEGDSGKKIVNAIISLGEGLSIPITAEGIEDAEILERLKEMGALKGQGYHYGHPETAADVEQRLTQLDRYSLEKPASDEASDAAANAVETAPSSGRKTA